MKALIFENKVVDIQPEPFPVAPSMEWYNAPEGCQVGWLLENGQIVTNDKRTDAEKAEDELTDLRNKRNSLLQKTDWWALSDVSMTQAQIDYRQALRDITNQFQSMNDEGFAWPTEPSA